jgi:hypothetical protein
VAAERLNWAGFDGWANGIADQLYERTTLIDFSSTQKGSRVPALARLFKLSAGDIIQQPDPASPILYRLILGANFNPCLRAAPVPVATATPTPTLEPTPAP